MGNDIGWDVSFKSVCFDFFSTNVGSSVIGTLTVSMTLPINDIPYYIKSLKIRGCKRWCPKDLRVRAPAAPVLTHFLSDAEIVQIIYEVALAHDFFTRYFLILFTGYFKWDQRIIAWKIENVKSDCIKFVPFVCYVIETIWCTKSVKVQWQSVVTFWYSSRNNVLF